MSRKFLTPIDLSGLEILNARFQNLATAPTPKGKGHVYYNTTDDTVYVYDGANWQASGKIVAGALASRPAAGSSGRLYFATDTDEKVLYFDNGTTWTKVGESKKYIDDSIANAIDDHNVSSGIHGVTGNVVGTSDTQTLTNKTISDRLHFNDGSAGGFIEGDAGNLVIDGNNTINVTADDDINLTTNNGNIVLNPDGGAYVGNSSSENNRIATLGDLGNEGVNSIVAGDNIEISSTGASGTGDVTVKLANNINVANTVTVGYDAETDAYNDGSITVKDAAGATTFETHAGTGETNIMGRVGFKDGTGTEKAHFEHSYTGTFRIISDDDISVRSLNGDVILYPGSDDGGPGRAYVGWGNDATNAGLGNEILTRDASQTITNKTVNDELLFTNPSTTPNDGGIKINDTTEDLEIKAYSADLKIESVLGDVVLTADGDVYKGSVAAGNEVVTRDETATLANKTLGTGTALGADLDANEYKITGLADPVNAQDAVNKRYVDGATAGLNWKEAVHLLWDDPAASGTGASGTLVIDGHAALTQADEGYRILLTNNGQYAGIYVYTDNGTTFNLVRATDADVFTELKGAAVFVMEGTLYGTTSWVQSNHYITSFTGQSWVQFSGSGTYTAGNGLQLDGTEFSVKIDEDHTGLSTSAAGLKVDIDTDGPLELGANGLDVKIDSTLKVDGTTGELGVDIATTGIARKVAEYVGNGVATSFTITHNLNTRDVTVTVYDAATYAEVFTDVSHSTADTVSVSFAEAPTTDQYRVVIVG